MSQVHHDDDPPYYTIMISGREKQTTAAQLFPIGTVPPPQSEQSNTEPTSSGFGFVTQPHVADEPRSEPAGSAPPTGDDDPAGGSAFSFIRQADLPALSSPGHYSSLFVVEDGSDPSGSYAAQCAGQLALDPGYNPEVAPVADESDPPAGAVSSFSFMNANDTAAMDISSVQTEDQQAGSLGTGGFGTSDPGAPTSSGFSFLSAPSDKPSTTPEEQSSAKGGGAFSFINAGSVEEIGPEPEEDLSAKIAEEAAHKRQSLAQELQAAKARGEQLTTVVTQLRGMLWDVEASHKECTRQIQQCTQQTILAMQQREQELLRQTNKVHAEKVAQLQKQSETLEQALMQVRSGCGIYEGAVHNSSNQELLGMADEMHASLHELAKLEFEAEPVVDAMLKFVPDNGVNIGELVTQEPKPISVEEAQPTPLSPDPDFNTAHENSLQAVQQVDHELVQDIPDLLDGSSNVLQVDDDLLTASTEPTTSEEPPPFTSAILPELATQDPVGVEASTDELLDLMDVSVLPQAVKKGSEGKKNKKDRTDKPKKGKKKHSVDEGTASTVHSSGAPPVVVDSPPPKNSFQLRPTLSIKNAAGQFESLWTSAALSTKASGRLHKKMSDTDLGHLMQQHQLVTIAGGAVNGIVKGYFMGEVDSGPGSMVMLEVVIDPGALMLEATLKVQEPTLLPAFAEYMGNVLGPVLK